MSTVPETGGDGTRDRKILPESCSGHQRRSNAHDTGDLSVPLVPEKLPQQPAAAHPSSRRGRSPDLRFEVHDVRGGIIFRSNMVPPRTSTVKRPSNYSRERLGFEPWEWEGNLKQSDFVIKIVLYSHELEIRLPAPPALSLSISRSRERGSRTVLKVLDRVSDFKDSVDRPGGRWITTSREIKAAC